MMATVIRANCDTDHCRADIQIPADEFTVVVFATSITYAFRCPQCGLRTAKLTTRGILELLDGTEARILHLDCPTDNRRVDPWTDDEILDLTIDLHRPDLIEAIQQETR